MTLMLLSFRGPTPVIPAPQRYWALCDVHGPFHQRPLSGNPCGLQASSTPPPIPRHRILPQPTSDCATQSTVFAAHCPPHITCRHATTNRPKLLEAPQTPSHHQRKLRARRLQLDPTTREPQRRRARGTRRTSPQRASTIEAPRRIDAPLQTHARHANLVIKSTPTRLERPAPHTETMSKITNKNLSYNSSLPPFLARLRGEAGGGSSYDGPDPILSARRRPVKPRSGSAEAEDAPTVVDAETGEVVRGVSVKDGVVTSLEVETPRGGEGEGEGEVMKEGEGGEVKKDEGEAGSGKKEEAKIGEGLMKRKRKVGRVVGAEQEDDGEGGREKGVVDGKEKDEGKGKSDGKGKSAGKKKAKKIKLSFGDEEG